MLKNKASYFKNIKNFFVSFYDMCYNAEKPAKYMVKFTLMIFYTLSFCGIATAIFPELAGRNGVDYVTEMLFSTAQRTLLLGVILAVLADYILYDSDKTER